MKKSKKITLTIVISMLVIFIGAIGGGYYYVNNMLNKIEKVDVNESNLGIDIENDKELSRKYGDVQNIALFGIDSVDGVAGRSDSIMILTIDRTTKKVKATSIMRDSYVDIPGKANKDKINHAYAFGGPELAIRTLNENFGLNIKDFIAVNFSSLPKIIDSIGGIDLEIDESELKYINNYVRNVNAKNNTSSPEIASAGKQHLDGTQAMAYCRIRYTSGGDYKRTERHREVLGKVFEKMQSVPVSKYQELLNYILPMTKTNLPSNDILTLGMDLVKIGGKLEEERFPRDKYCEGKLINSLYYLIFNEEATKEQIYNWIYENSI